MKINLCRSVPFLITIFFFQAIPLLIPNQSAISQTQTTPKVAPKPSLSPTTHQSTKPKWDSPRLVHTLDILTDAEKGEDFYKNIPMYFGKPYPLAISPDGKKLASGGVNTIRLWDLQTGNEIGEPLFSAQGIKPLGISSISFSSDGKILNVFSTGNEILESSNSNNIEPTANNSSQSSNSISRIGEIDNWFRQDQVSVGISFKSVFEKFLAIKKVQKSFQRYSLSI